MKAAGYCRVSSTEQVDGTSLDVQQAQIQAYAQMKGIELVTIFIDPAVSGSVPLNKRPEGSKLCRLVDTGVVDCVIFPKLDRGFRSASDCLNVIEAWQQLNVGIHVVDLGGNSIDTATPSGKFMITVLAAAAEMERGMIQERCNTGRQTRKREGRCIGEVPFGWTLGPDGSTLVENPDEQEALRLINSLHHDKHSLRSIAAELVRRGIPAKKGGIWTHKQVADILRRAA